MLLTIDFVMWLVQLGGRFPFFHSTSFYRILAWCFLAVALFLQNKTLVFSGITANMIITLYNRGIGLINGYFSASLLFDSLSAVLAAVIVFSALINKPKLAALWFLPAALRAADFVYYLVGAGFAAGWPVWLFIFIFDILYVALLALVGYWIHIFPFTPRSAVISAPKQKVDTVGLLRKYSALLDSGAITEEEFQEIKRKLLNP